MSSILKLRGKTFLPYAYPGVGEKEGGSLSLRYRQGMVFEVLDTCIQGVRFLYLASGKGVLLESKP